MASTFHEAALQTVVNELSLPLALRETLFAQQARVPEEDLETGAFDDADRLLVPVSVHRVGFDWQSSTAQAGHCRVGCWLTETSDSLDSSDCSDSVSGC